MGKARSKSCSFVAELIPQAEGGCFVQCPTLPGCYSQGETVEESLANIRKAIKPTIEDLEASGEMVPESGAPIVTKVAVAA